MQDEFSIDAIEIFLESTEELVESLEMHFRNRNWKDFERGVHNLKGTAKTVGALILGNLALQLELWVKDGHAGSIEADLDRLAVEYRALSLELDRYCQGLKKKRRHIS